LVLRGGDNQIPKIFLPEKQEYRNLEAYYYSGHKILDTAPIINVRNTDSSREN